ncbi:MAG TPA: hypothetical protein VE685_15400 [Thermoanaerobaculia bacterium]|nr:hypothetical protein [Thermoanaerobaculia bacterium]
MAALEARTDDTLRGLARVEDNVNGLIDRISRVEVQVQLLRESVRNEILADIKAEVAVVRFALSQRQAFGSLPPSSGGDFEPG